MHVLSIFGIQTWLASSRIRHELIHSAKLPSSKTSLSISSQRAAVPWSCRRRRRHRHHRHRSYCRRCDGQRSNQQWIKLDSFQTLQLEDPLSFSQSLHSARLFTWTGLASEEIKQSDRAHFERVQSDNLETCLLSKNLLHGQPKLHLYFTGSHAYVHKFTRLSIPNW